MPAEKFTRCPSCRTVFRVTAAQLEMRGGQVRCGHCKAVFDGHEHMISLAPRSPEEEAHDDDEMALGPPTVTLRSAQSLTPAAQPLSATAAAARAHFDIDEDDAAPPPVKPAPPSPRRWQRVLWGAAIPLLALALLLQAVFHFRDAVASRWPAANPALTRMCDVVGCVLRPMREITDLSIDSSDLQADPAHKGLLILSATIRNRAAHALGYPYLELTLSNAQDQIVVRRAFAPGEYLSGAANLDSGIAGNAELTVKLFIDASTTSQAGYQVYLFYP